MIAPPPTRAAANRQNALRSTGPRTEAGKQRSSLNALRHGLTARTPVLPTEDPAAYQSHILQFLDEYQPATPTENQLVHEIANTARRLNRIPFLEAGLLSCAAPANPEPSNPELALDIVATHRALATLGVHGQRLSRQFQKAVDRSATSKTSAAVWSAASSTTQPTFAFAINAKDFRGTRSAFFQKMLASFFQKSKSNATPNC